MRANVQASIGPNAVLQTRRALDELEGPAAVRTIAGRCAVPATLPDGMIPEAWFTLLIGAVRETLPSSRAEAVLRRSGALTAAYVSRRRIPAPFRLLLRLLPPRIGVPLLFSAFHRHAWTFAGSGAFDVERRYPGALLLDGSPTCRTCPRERTGGSYYEGAFEGLLQLAAPGARVREVACQALGAPLCRFEIRLPSQPGDAACASS